MRIGYSQVTYNITVTPEGRTIIYEVIMCPDGHCILTVDGKLRSSGTYGAIMAYYKELLRSDR